MFAYNEDECKIETFRRNSDKLHQNESAIRLTHLPTETIIECSKYRSYHQNLENCYLRLNILLNLQKVSEEERIEVFNNFCTHCGTEQLPCYCMRDD